MKKAIIIETYTKVDIGSTFLTSETKQLEVYTKDYEKAEFNRITFLPQINPLTISCLLGTMQVLKEENYDIEIKCIKQTDYNEETIKKLLN